MEQQTAPTSIAPDALLTIRGLCREIRRLAPPGDIGVGERVISAAIHSGQLPAVRIGRSYRVLWRDWLAWLAAQRVAPSTDPTPRSDAADWARRKITDEETRATGG